MRWTVLCLAVAAFACSSDDSPTDGGSGLAIPLAFPGEDEASIDSVLVEPFQSADNCNAEPSRTSGPIIVSGVVPEVGVRAYVFWSYLAEGQTGVYRDCDALGVTFALEPVNGVQPTLSTTGAQTATLTRLDSGTSPNSGIAILHVTVSLDPTNITASRPVQQAN
jgi:hypothetical protein